MKTLHCLAYMQPSLILIRTDNSKKYRALHLGLLWQQELPESYHYWEATTYRAPLRVFCLDIIPSPFPCLDMTSRQRRCKISVFLILDWQSSWPVVVHLPDVVDYEAPVFLLLSFSCLKLSHYHPRLWKTLEHIWCTYINIIYITCFRS